MRISGVWQKVIVDQWDCQAAVRVLAARWHPRHGLSPQPRKPRGAERRETPGRAKPRERLAKPPGTLARRAALPCDRECAPPGAPPRLFSFPGHAFCIAL